jgi:hypothetical protein
MPCESAAIAEARAWPSLKLRGVNACKPSALTLDSHALPASACGGVLAAGNGSPADLLRAPQGHWSATLTIDLSNQP